MADDLQYTEGSGATIATDEIGGKHYQRVKVVLGADGVNDGDVESGNPLPIDGTVTANAGTNLNTSALALESGGNLAGAATSLAILDDWDESDRAKVNPIVGQAGVQGGAGAVSATTQRVVLPTDQTAIPVTQSGTWDEVGINDSGNSITVDYATTGSGTATGALRVELPTNGTGVIATVGAVTAITNALPAGTNAIGKLSANSGVDIGDVDVTTVGTITPGVAASSLGKAEDAAHASGDTGVAVWQVRDDTLSVFSGNENDYEPFHSDANGATWVHPTDSVAHDAADAGNGIKIAAKAVATTSTQTMVAANDRTDLYADLDGTQLARNQVPLGDLLSERVSDTAGTSAAFTVFDNAAGKRNYITSVTVHNAHASTNGYVDLRDGTAGTILWTFPLPATGGATHNFNPPLRQPTAATALAYDVSAAITTVYISINGFKSKL